MDYLWIVLGLILILAGIAGCFLPVIPGPPLAYISLLLIQLTNSPPFTTSFLLWMAVGTAAITIMDYFIPPMATKKFGGSRYGVVGSFIGIFAGIIFFPPWGLLIFPFIGAYLGETFFGNDPKTAKRAAIGSALGILSGILVKLSFTIFIAYLFFVNAPWT